MKRSRSTADELRQEINRIVNDTRLVTTEDKLKAIFALDDGNLKTVAWRDVKDDRKFWMTVIEALELVNYEAITETGNQNFGYPEITRILGQTLANRMLEGFNAMGLAQTESYYIAKSQFIKYMLLYIDDAKFHFLVVYGYFLKVSDALKIPYEETRRQETACLSISPVAKSILIEDVTESFHVFTIFKLVMPHGAPRIYTFYMTKDATAPTTYQFVIQLGGGDKVILTMNGPITSVLKFYYTGNFYIVIKGEKDQKLLKFKHDELKKVTVVDRFSLDPDKFDDAIYGKLLDRIAFPTNTKSVTYLRDLLLIRQERFQSMNPQPIRKLNELSTKEKGLFVKARDSGVALNNRQLDKKEFVIVNALRPKSKPSTATKLSDLSIAEVRAITEGTGFVYLQTEYEYGRLFEVLKDDKKVKFVEAESALGGALADVDHKPGDLRCMATKILRLPFRTGVSPENTANIHIAMLVRRYTKAGGGAYDTLLYLFSYRNTKNVYEPDLFAEVVLPPFTHTDDADTTYSIAEMNLIFHTPRLFYVEVKEKAFTQKFGGGDDFAFVNSQLISYDFQFDEKSPPTLLVESVREREMMRTKRDARLELKDEREREMLFLDGALFEEVRKQGYKVYDYRHDIDAQRVSKYDCIFYRYNVVKAKGRLIFYKKGEQRPSVADIYIDSLRPQDIITITPSQKTSSNDLCFLSMARLVQLSYETLEGGTMLKSHTEPQILKLISAGERLPDYDKNTYSLSAKLQQSLTISSALSPTHCVFCGQSGGVKDSLTNYHYCDRLCQRLFCTTNRC